MAQATRRHRREWRRQRRARRRRLLALGTIGSAIVVAIVLLIAGNASDGGPPASGVAPLIAQAAQHQRNRFARAPAPAAEQVRVRFHKPPRSGILVDLDSGKVLWSLRPERVLPIASLTKMMTALLVAERARESDRVLITRAAVDYQGSGVGLLPLHRRIALRTLLYGLLLPSGNDAAIALAQHVAGGSVARFVELMNAHARALGLGCTRFASPSGFVDRGNHSCAPDLALLARLILRSRELAPIVAARTAAFRFPIKGGRIFLYNNNPLLRTGYPGADGVKTGYTVAAGRCLVASAHRGEDRLIVVLLHSGDPPDQARRLLDLGFRALARARAIPARLAQ
jgi:D-alanyl-D-alanine carboxypeptidase